MKAKSVIVTLEYSMDYTESVNQMLEDEILSSKEEIEEHVRSDFFEEVINAPLRYINDGDVKVSIKLEKE